MRARFYLAPSYRIKFDIVGKSRSYELEAGTQITFVFNSRKQYECMCVCVQLALICYTVPVCTAQGTILTLLRRVFQHQPSQARQSLTEIL